MLFFNVLSVLTILPVAGTPDDLNGLCDSSYFLFDWDEDCLHIRRSRHTSNINHMSAILLHLPCCCCYFLLASLDRAFVEGFRAGIYYAYYFYRELLLTNWHCSDLQRSDLVATSMLYSCNNITDNIISILI